MAPIKKISCESTCGCYKGLICDDEDAGKDLFLDLTVPPKKTLLDLSLSRRRSSLHRARNALEFARSSLALLKFSRQVNEEDLGRKAYYQSLKLFPSAMDTRPARTARIMRTYKDTIQEERRKQRLARLLVNAS